MERSLHNLQVEAIDLLQLHGPPIEVFYLPEVFGMLDDLVAAADLPPLEGAIQSDVAEDQSGWPNKLPHTVCK